MKPFRFKNFEIHQRGNVFRVGTDGLLLGLLSKPRAARNVLEVGTGTGLVSLVLAQREPALMVTALDINPEAVELASLNFQNSPFSNRLTASTADFKTFESKDVYDMIICNPPYFEQNASNKDVFARQTVELDAVTVLQKSASLLSDEGFVSLIVPAAQAEALQMCGAECELHLIRKVNISGICNGPLKRNILEFSKKKSPLITEKFTIEKSPRKYSDQYLDLTRDFHVFGKSK